MEGRPVALPLAEHHIPAESGLGALEREHLEQMPVVMHRHAPFGVVVMGEDVLSRAVAETACQPVRRDEIVRHAAPLRPAGQQGARQQDTA